MKKTGFALALIAMLALPSGAMAAPKAEKAASKACHDARAAAESKAAFRAEFGNFGKCVSLAVKSIKAAQREARQEARAECAAEEGKARGQCVRAQRQAAKEARREARGDFVNAAETCRDLRDEDEAAFLEEYGTNGKEGKRGYKRNAFGKCVSEHAKAQNEEEEEEEAPVEE